MVKLIRLGNPILREACRELLPEEILSSKIQQLINQMKTVVADDDHGVGISANQIGEAVRISVIAIKPTSFRPNREHFGKVLINPEIIETFGRRVGVWEGCLSGGKDKLFGRVLRYKKVRVKYLDEKAVPHEITLTDLPAHVIQHEVDHLNGIFFTDKVQRKSLMMADEYRSRIVGTKFGNYYEKNNKK